jgi:dihydroxy-acid dehydratase
MDDMDRLSHKTPCLCKVAPSSHYHIEDVNRAGGILGIMAELNRGGLLNTDVYRVDGLKLGAALAKYDIMQTVLSSEVENLYKSAPGRKFNLVMGSQNSQYKELDKDRIKGCIRNIENAYTIEGGLAILKGNIAQNGCVIKTAGVDESIWKFSGPVVVITHEGPKGGPGMQEMLYPTSYIKSRGLGKACALITDGRFSGGTSGLSIGHISPEAASGGNIGLIKDGDIIEIDIVSRSINVKLSDEELKSRRDAELAKGKDAFKPSDRNRVISKALKAYASMVTSADKGAVRVID